MNSYMPMELSSKNPTEKYKNVSSELKSSVATDRPKPCWTSQTLHPYLSALLSLAFSLPLLSLRLSFLAFGQRNKNREVHREPKVVSIQTINELGQYHTSNTNREY